MYRLNTENGVKPTFEVKHDQGGFVKEIPRDRIYLFSWRLRDYIYIVPGIIYITPHTYVEAANQYIIPYFRRNYIQKPPPDFKTLYCSWHVYSSDKHLKRIIQRKPTCSCFKHG